MTARFLPLILVVAALLLSACTTTDSASATADVVASNEGSTTMQPAVTPPVTAPEFGSVEIDSTAVVVGNVSVVDNFGMRTANPPPVTAPEFGSIAVVVGNVVSVADIFGMRTANPPSVPAPAPTRSVVRVTVTGQPFDYFRPWRKDSPSSKQGIGTVIPGPMILVTARLVESATYVELEPIDGGDKVPATVEFVDYAANLALLKPEDPSILDGLVPLEIDSKVKVGDAITAWQFESNGTPFLTEGVLRSVELSSYAYVDTPYLVYRIEMSLSQAVSSFTIPVVHNGHLIGLLMGYNNDTKMLTVVSAPIIEHFLTDLKDGQYDGFPVAGFALAPLDDQQLRRYVGIESGGKGVLISYVRPGSASDKAGLKQGDVLLAINNDEIDKHGEFEDPLYGKMSLSYLTTTRHFVGETIQLQVFREGKEQTLPLVLESMRLEDYPIVPFELDQAPEYLVIGGMVFQELSRQFLKEFGGNWRGAAPRRLVYLDENQWDLYKPGEHQVMITRVLPTSATNGYTGFNFLMVKSINDQPIHSLHDVPVALQKPLNGFHHIKFDEHPYEFVLDARILPRLDQAVQQAYGLPRLGYLRAPAAQEASSPTP